ncbi:MAG: metallophosphoesterase [Alphaproteobacteria bacterium]
MKTNVREDKIILMSDVHLGNPFCTTKREIGEFLEWVSTTDYALCINGDWLEIAQTSFTKLAREAPELMSRLSSIFNAGNHLYYVVGNHDIVFEHFIEAWGGFQVVPFLNVRSSDKRIRVEHGHLYDPFFSNHPAAYEFVTHLAGYFLHAWPRLYYQWIRFEKLKSRFRRPEDGEGIEGEDKAFSAAADEILRRGFDVVCFGHTHHAGVVNLGEGRLYVNTGTWLFNPTFVVIENGEVSLQEWRNGEPVSVFGH